MTRFVADKRSCQGIAPQSRGQRERSNKDCREKSSSYTADIQASPPSDDRERSGFDMYFSRILFRGGETVANPHRTRSASKNRRRGFVHR